MTRLPQKEAASILTGSSGLSTGRDPSSAWGRFAPGILFASRFRIVAPLGRGGMGEVYRADDLRLGQTVALKLLPAHLTHDPGRLAQFHNEVRIARTISHRNVCRVHDIGDADGVPFLTMEYVDGEDLASLLRRIGRFPQDKAIEVARQICAGLAAAHERGVLHRDLKPANVMIDGDGHVRLTDFGLAALAESVDNVRAGTPAYMAPEQLTGKEVTARSDIYSLGLVLFELFTGKRAFEAATLNDLLSMHESGSVSPPSSVVRDLDPAVERAILRCLEHSPLKRPPSALAVSAALPGGDQLAAALAAGETPSPEMVAAAGEHRALRASVGVSLVAFTLAMLTVIVALSEKFSLIHRIPMPRSVDSLRDRAQDVINALGYRTPPYDSAHGWTISRDYLSYASREGVVTPNSWPQLETGRSGTLSFWYRTSPVALVTTGDNLTATPTEPPLTLSDMRLVRLDATGRLTEFHSVPPQLEDAPATGPPVDWTPLFTAAGLDPASFHEVAPRWAPRNDADVRKAWEGTLAELPGITTRVEAASNAGRPIFFFVAQPWTQPTRMATPRPRTLTDVLVFLSIAIGLLVVAGAALLAQRHLKSGRGDRRGALRTAAIVFATETAARLLTARHFSSFDLEYRRVSDILATALLSAAGIWMLYIAFEPYVRRFWPQLMIGWSRLVSGRIRDPQVGRDVLVGAAAGTIAALLIESREFVPYLLSHHVQDPPLPIATMLLGTQYTLGGALANVLRALRNAVQCVCIVVFMKILVRRTWLVLLLSTITLIPIAASGTFAGELPLFELTVVVSGIALVFGVLLKFGLLALVVTFYTFLALDVFPVTADLSRPYAGASLVLVLAIAAVSAFGFYASRGDEPLFGRDLLD